MKDLRSWLAAIGLVVLLILHVDAWRTPSPTLWGGVLPAELGWRIGWMIAAWIYLILFARWVWGNEEDAT